VEKSLEVKRRRGKENDEKTAKKDIKINGLDLINGLVNQMAGGK